VRDPRDRDLDPAAAERARAPARPNEAHRRHPAARVAHAVRAARPHPLPPRRLPAAPAARAARRRRLRPSDHADSPRA